jgi:hypothetical protein
VTRPGAPVRTPAAAPVTVPVEVPEAEQPKGCLYALSQPPLMLFLCVIGGLIGAGAVWDLMLFL